MTVDSKLVCDQNGGMNMAINLPESLVKGLQSRAAHDGLDFDQVVADLLCKALAAQPRLAETLDNPVIVIDPVSGLPTIQGGRQARPGEELTPDRVAEILLEQEVEWHLAAGR